MLQSLVLLRLLRGEVVCLSFAPSFSSVSEKMFSLRNLRALFERVFDSMTDPRNDTKRKPEPTRMSLMPFV